MTFFKPLSRKTKIQIKQTQFRAAMKTAVRINCTSDSFGLAFYGLYIHTSFIL